MFHPLHSSETGGRADQRHRGAAVSRRFGQGIAHPPRRTVCQVAHRVQRLLGAACSHEHPQSGQRSFPAQRLPDGCQKCVSGRQTPTAHAPRGQPALVWLHNDRPAPSQGRCIGLRSRVRPHVRIHGGSQHQRRRASQHGRGQQVVRDTIRQLGQRVRRGRRNHDQIRPFGEGDVRHIGRIQRLEHIH